MKKVILFDFFGTLVDYTPGSYFQNQRRETYDYLQQQGIDFTYSEWERRCRVAYQELSEEGRKTSKEFHMHDLMKRILGDKLPKTNQKSFIEAVSSRYLEEWNHDVIALPDLPRLLDRLSKRYTLGIISNTHDPHLVPDNLWRLGVLKYFQQITTSITYGTRKPHPSIFEETLKNMKVKVEDAIFVGDSYEDDYLGAKQVKMKAYLIDTKKHYLHLGENRLDTLFDLDKLV